jgi:hypothetical protein
MAGFSFFHFLQLPGWQKAWSHGSGNFVIPETFLTSPFLLKRKGRLVLTIACLF